MAENRAQDDRVRDFARMLARDHNPTFETNPSGIIPLNRNYQKTVDRLSRLTGEEFDRKFIDIIVREHRQAIHLFEQLTDEYGMKKAHDALPSLRQHLREAEAIRQYLRGRR